MELKGKTAIVTGSGSGIGRAIALEFARRGANVVCCARRERAIQETAAMIEKVGVAALAVPTDITQKSQVENMISQSLNRFGAIDVLYNNAGSFQAIGGLWEVDPEVWWRDVTVNLLGSMLCSRAVLGHMIQRDRGIIINMDGGGSCGPLTGGSGYGCSKAAVLRLTDTLAAELEKINSSVMVFALGPGLVQTEMTELQAQTEAGQKWIPSTKEMFDNNQTRSPNECAIAAVNLVRVACPALVGRTFAVDTDFDKVVKRLDDIQRDDLMTLRMKSFK